MWCTGSCYRGITRLYLTHVSLYQSVLAVCLLSWQDAHMCTADQQRQIATTCLISSCCTLAVPPNIYSTLAAGRCLGPNQSSSSQAGLSGLRHPPTASVLRTLGGTARVQQPAQDVQGCTVSRLPAVDTVRGRSQLSNGSMHCLHAYIDIATVSPEPAVSQSRLCPGMQAAWQPRPHVQHKSTACQQLLRLTLEAV